MITLIWLTALLMLLLWSLVLGGLWALLLLDPAWVDHLAGWLDDTPAGLWLTQWLPGWVGLVTDLIDIAQRLIQSVAWLLPWLLGATWLAGTSLLLVCAGLLHWMVRTSTSSTTPTAPLPGRSPGAVS
jgi:hypothetical protein